jgi:ribonuclease BN (tRNA processing enzyme)
LEIGIQTFNPEVAQRIARPLNIQIVETNLRKLAALPAVHLHADLIAGLPGESFESLADGFDQLHACGPDEIQLGLLKKLRGAPIARHDTAWQMVYNSSPPYDVLQTSALSFIELQRIRRFARYWDITVNNGRFPHTAQKIWEKNPSVFAAFMEWSDWLYEQTHATWGFSPEKLAWYLEAFLTGRRGLPAATVRSALEQDLCPCATASAKGRERQYRAAVRRG